MFEDPVNVVIAWFIESLLLIYWAMLNLRGGIDHNASNKLNCCRNRLAVLKNDKEDCQSCVMAPERQ